MGDVRGRRPAGRPYGRNGGARPGLRIVFCGGMRSNRAFRRRRAPDKDLGAPPLGASGAELPIITRTVAQSIDRSLSTLWDGARGALCVRSFTARDRRRRFRGPLGWSRGDWL